MVPIPPRQARSRKTMQRLATAAMALLEEHGGTGFSVNDVVRRAGSSVGSFYARFAGKDELLEYVGSEMWKDALTRWEEARTSSEWAEMRLDRLLRALIGLFDDSERMHLRARAALGPDFFGPEALHFREQIEAGAVELVLQHRQGLGHADPEDAALFGIRLIQAAIRDPTVVTADPEFRSEDLDRLSVVMATYLTGSLDGASAEGDVDFFDVWG